MFFTKISQLYIKERTHDKANFLRGGGVDGDVTA